jgi:hypothetical protein
MYCGQAQPRDMLCGTIRRQPSPRGSVFRTRFGSDTPVDVTEACK